MGAYRTDGTPTESEAMSVADQFRYHEKALAQMGIYRERLDGADSELLVYINQLCLLNKRSCTYSGSERRDEAAEWLSRLTVAECRALRPNTMKAKMTDTSGNSAFVRYFAIAISSLAIGYALGHLL